jgi:hypothetical protein
MQVGNVNHGKQPHKYILTLLSDRHHNGRKLVQGPVDVNENDTKCGQSPRRKCEGVSKIVAAA